MIVPSQVQGLGGRRHRPLECSRTARRQDAWPGSISPHRASVRLILGVAVASIGVIRRYKAACCLSHSAARSVFLTVYRIGIGIVPGFWRWGCGT